MNNMNRSLIIAAALASVGASAFAQSTVTLYGRLNLTVERQKVGNGPNNWVMQNSSSRFGLKGSEDLGGGMKAGCQSEINLSGGFGMVRLGNFTSEAYYATSDYIGMHNHETGTSSDAFYAYVGRNTGKIAYRTPNFSGATVEIAITEAGANPDRSVDLAANYDAGPLHLGFGYEKNGDAKQFAGRVLYELGAFTLGGTVQRDTDGFGAGFGNRTNYRLSGMYTMGKTELHANFGAAGDYSNLAGTQKANQYTLGVNQNLSKRTKVYGFVTKVADKGTIYGDFQSLAVGVRHNF
jgi:predicted porin